MDPHRPGAGQGRAVRYDDRARLPHPVTADPAVVGVAGRPRGPHQGELRPGQGAFPSAGSGGVQGAGDGDPGGT